VKKRISEEMEVDRGWRPTWKTVGKIFTPDSFLIIIKR